MRKKYLCWIAGLLAVVAVGVASCKDDDDDTPKKEEVEQPEENVVQAKWSADMQLFDNGFVQVNEQIVLCPYVVEDGKYSLVTDWKVVKIEYDKEYVSVDKKRNDQGNLVGISVTGIQQKGNTKVEITYSYKNKTFKSVVTLEVLESDKDKNDAARRAALRSYITNQINSATIDLNFGATKLPAYLETSDGSVMVINRGEKTVSSGKVDGFKFRPIYKNSNIYPGSLVYVNTDLANGTPSAVQFGSADDLGTVTVYLKIASGDSIAKKGVKRSPDAIQQAIGELIENVVIKGGHIPPGEVQAKRVISNSVKKLAIAANMSASYAGAEMGISASTTESSSKMYSLTSFTQEFYTVGIAVENGDVTTLFGKGVTADLYKQKEAGRGKIAIIKSVSYGRYGWYKKEYESKGFTFKGSDSVSYKQIASVSSTQDITQQATSTNEEGKIIGGTTSVAVDAFKNDSLFDVRMMDSEALLVSATNQGVPVFYEVEYLSGDPINVEMNGSCENVASYVKCTSSLTYKLRNEAGYGDVKPKLIYRTFKFVDGVKTTVKEAVVNEFTFDGHGEKTQTIDLPKDGGDRVFFEPVAYFGIRYKGCKSNNDWAQCVDQSNKVYIGDGDLNMVIEGTCACSATSKAPYIWSKSEDHLNENVNFPDIDLPTLK